MLFSFAVRSLYIESCSMYVRGGVYVVVRDAMGPFLARLSVSAIIFDYILTGPISAVSAGHYLGRLINEISEMLNAGMTVTPAQFVAIFALVVTVYFWWMTSEPKRRVVTLATSLRCSSNDPDPANVADVPTHCMEGELPTASRTRLTNIATSAPWRPR